MKRLGIIKADAQGPWRLERALKELRPSKIAIDYFPAGIYEAEEEVLKSIEHYKKALQAMELQKNMAAYALHMIRIKDYEIIETAQYCRRTGAKAELIGTVNKDWPADKSLERFLQELNTEANESRGLVKAHALMMDAAYRDPEVYEYVAQEYPLYLPENPIEGDKEKQRMKTEHIREELLEFNPDLFIASIEQIFPSYGICEYDGSNKVRLADF